jgi:hypothetical protein
MGKYGKAKMKKLKSEKRDDGFYWVGGLFPVDVNKPPIFFPPIPEYKQTIFGRRETKRSKQISEAHIGYLEIYQFALAKDIREKGY